MLINKTALLGALLLLLQLTYGMQSFELDKEKYGFDQQTKKYKFLNKMEVDQELQLVKVKGKKSGGAGSIEETFKAELPGIYEEGQVCEIAEEGSKAKIALDSGNLKEINKTCDIFPHTVFKGSKDKEFKPTNIVGFTQKTKLTRNMIGPVNYSADFTVMNFNILADGLSSVYDVPGTEKDFVHPKKEYLDWKVRGKQIIEEMQDADIIVVEENDRFDDIYRALNVDGNYDGIMMPKVDSPIANLNQNKIVEAQILEKILKAPLPNDGISIYWNTTKFEYTGELKQYLEANKWRITNNIPINSKLEEKPEFVYNSPEFKAKMKAFHIQLNSKLSPQDREKAKKDLNTFFYYVKTYNDNVKILNKFTDVKETKLTYHGKKGSVDHINYTRVLDVEFKEDIIVGLYPVRKFFGNAKKMIKPSKEVYIALKLTHKATKNPIVVAGSHLKSEKNANGELTRMYQANYLMEQVKSNFDEQYPVVFCADMNAAHVPLMFQKGNPPDFYYPETYNHLTQTLKMIDSQVELMKDNATEEKPYDKYAHYTTAKVREGKASTIVEDYILYKNTDKSDKVIKAVAYLEAPDLKTIHPLYLPGSHYPSDHIAIRTDFKFDDHLDYVATLMKQVIMNMFTEEQLRGKNLKAGISTFRDITGMQNVEIKTIRRDDGAAEHVSDYVVVKSRMCAILCQENCDAELKEKLGQVLGI